MRLLNSVQFSKGRVVGKPASNAALQKGIDTHNRFIKIFVDLFGSGTIKVQVENKKRYLNKNSCFNLVSPQGTDADRKSFLNQSKDKIIQDVQGALDRILSRDLKGVNPFGLQEQEEAANQARALQEQEEAANQARALQEQEEAANQARAIQEQEEAANQARAIQEQEEAANQARAIQDNRKEQIRAIRQSYVNFINCSLFQIERSETPHYPGSAEHLFLCKEKVMGMLTHKKLWSSEDYDSFKDKITNLDFSQPNILEQLDECIEALDSVPNAL